MFDYFRLQKLRRQKRRYETANRRSLNEYEYFGSGKDNSMPPDIVMKVYDYEHQIRDIETNILRRKAEKWGIEVRKSWLEPIYTPDGEPVPLFTDEGTEAIEEAIRTKKKHRREGIEWWVIKIIVPVLGALTGLIGVLLAIYALNK